MQHTGDKRAAPGDGDHKAAAGRGETALPQVFGRYLLVQRLSRGGMGEIFLAKHGLSGFEKLAVIKKVLPHLAADKQFISRFVDEAQVAIKLQHVNVAQVFEVGRVGEEYFLALEYVEGRDLRRTLALLAQTKQRLPVDLALFIGRELANGLAYAHRRTGNDGTSLNLVHCDISPPNVLVSFEGETKVIDFGIAKSAIRGTATDPKMGFGKFAYMAPEQLIRGGIVDHRTDIYAAGVVLFELLTSKRLYEAGAEPDYRALAKKVAKGEHMMPSDVDAVLAPYDDLVATALRPKADDRYQTAAEFRDAIQQALVAVNPTISTDQLGAYMRDLFANEMTAQRELHERVAKAHLEDFQDQLTKETGTTVSFALANLPIQPPRESAPVVPRTRTPTKPPAEANPRAPTAQTQILAAPTAGATTAGIETLDVPLADGTGSLPPELRAPTRRKLAFLIGGIAAFALGAVAIYAMAGGGGDKPAAQVAANAARVGSGDVAVAPTPHVESIPVDEQEPPAGSAAPSTAGSSSGHVGAGSDVDVQLDPPRTSVGTPDKHGPKHVGRDRPHGGTSAASPAHADTPRHSELTREAVATRFSQVKREYDAFKAKNGGRLDGEWGDLATFMQFQLRQDTLDEAMRKLETFRGKLHSEAP